MTLKIEVTVPQDEISDNTAARYLARAMSALGFHRDADGIDLTGGQGCIERQQWCVVFAHHGSEVAA